MLIVPCQTQKLSFQNIENKSCSYFKNITARKLYAGYPKTKFKQHVI